MRRLSERDIVYEHIPLSESGLNKKGHELLPVVHLVISLLKRWILQTHQAGVREHQLQGYLDEFVFRFNRRNSSSRGLVFWRLVCSLMETTPVTHALITSRKDELEAQDEETASRVEEVQLDERRKLSRQTSAAHYERSKATKGGPPAAITRARSQAS